MADIQGAPRAPGCWGRHRNLSPWRKARKAQDPAAQRCRPGMTPVSYAAGASAGDLENCQRWPWRATGISATTPAEECASLRTLRPVLQALGGVLLLGLVLATPAQAQERRVLDSQKTTLSNGGAGGRPLDRAVDAKPRLSVLEDGRLQVSPDFIVGGPRPPLPALGDPPGELIFWETEGAALSRLYSPEIVVTRPDGRTVGFDQVRARGHVWVSKEPLRSLRGLVLRIRFRYWDDSATLVWPLTYTPTLEEVRQALDLVRRVYGELVEVRDLPVPFLDVIEYRVGLLERFFAFDALLQTGTAIEIGGAVGGERPLIERDVLYIGLVYMDLVTRPRPRDLTPRSKANWQRAHPALIFKGPLEYSAVNRALERSQVVRARTMAAASLEGMVGTALFGVTLLPGGTLFWSANILATGEDIDGRVATWVDKLFAVADIALDVGPVVLGVLRTKARVRDLQARRALTNYLEDRNALRRRLRQAGDDRLVKEGIQTEWLDMLDNATGRKGITLSYRDQRFARADGRLLPQPGIDRYVYPPRGSTALATSREYKRVQQFDGTWTHSSTSLADARVRIEGLHTSDVPATQNSWSWIVDRGMRSYRYARDNGLTAELQASRDLLERFRDGRLTRSLVVMTDEGEVFFSNERILRELCNEAPNSTTGDPVTLDALRGAVRRFLDANR